MGTIQLIRGSKEAASALTGLEGEVVLNLTDLRKLCKMLDSSQWPLET